jgi:hypothetical protein
MEPTAGHGAWDEDVAKHDRLESTGEQEAQSTASHEWESQAGHNHQNCDDNDAAGQNTDHQRIAKNMTNQGNQVPDQQHQEKE